VKSLPTVGRLAFCFQLLASSSVVQGLPAGKHGIKSRGYSVVGRFERHHATGVARQWGAWSL